MKYVIAIWAAPLVLFWGWFFLSLHDINFGSVYLSRQLHELVFKLYGEMLGVDPGSIPARCWNSLPPGRERTDASRPFARATQHRPVGKPTS